MSKKLGFGAVLAVVFGSQIGSGIFAVPATLAPFGKLSIFGWLLAGFGAILLALVFAELCSKFPKTGGPHTYVYEMFGQMPAFFVGWTYWLVSWVSSSVVVVTAVASLHPFLGKYQSPYVYLSLEIFLLLFLTCVNCRSVILAGRLESFLVILKFIPFVVVPAIILRDFDLSKATILNEYKDVSIMSLISSASSIAFWGFIGVECATTPAEFVENPSKTIPRAIILGTIGVALIYLVNNTVIMGVVPSEVLANSKAPFVDAINIVLGKNSSLIISLATFLICTGTLNAWILTSSQISLGLAKDNLLPQILAKKNQRGAPYISVLISSFGIIPILILTKNERLSAQISCIIDFSVESFFLVYVVSSLACLKLAWKNSDIKKIILCLLAVAFCIFMIVKSSIQSILIATLFTVSGIFVIPFIPSKKLKKNSLS